MGADQYQEYLRRADAAGTVRELRSISDEVQAAFPGDLEAGLIASTCFAYATALIEVGAERRAIEQQRLRQRQAAPARRESSAERPSRIAGRAYGRELAFRIAADTRSTALVD